ncbi:Ig-like domain-containing protein [Dyadobacter bucti]|uniref:Ig-like domain-containing protein n=1 Tax=Dyadobacter bucti TaxID=2572203 RepID=UPI003F6F5E9C
MKRLLLVLTLVTLISGSCTKKTAVDVQPEEDKGTILGKKTHVLETNTIITSDSVHFSLNNSASYKPQVDDIVIANPTAENEFGFMSKIVGITPGTSQTTYQTVPAGLNEAFEQLYIKTSYSDSSLIDGNLRTSSLIDYSFGDGIGQVDGLTYSGRLKINLQRVDIEYVKNKGFFEPEKMLIQAVMNSEGSSFQIANQSDKPVKVAKEKTLKRIRLPVIRVPIPGTPIFISLAQIIKLNVLPITVSGKAKWKISPLMTATAGTKYENDAWSNVSSYKINNSLINMLLSDFSKDFSITASGTIFKPIYEIAPYGLEALKGFFEVPSGFDFVMQQKSPNVSLDYKLDVTGGIKTNFWFSTPTSYSVSSSMVNKRLIEADFLKIDSPLITFNGDCGAPQTPNRNYSTMVSFEVSDIFDLENNMGWQIVEKVGNQNPVTFSAPRSSDGNISYRACINFGNTLKSIPITIYLKAKNGFESNHLNFAFIKPEEGKDPQRIQIVSGDKQLDTPGKELAKPLIVKVTDANGDPVEGVAVKWRIKNGSGGSLTTADIATNAQGLAEAKWKLGTTGIQEVEVSAKKKNFYPLDGSPLKFTVDPGEIRSRLLGKWILEKSNIYWAGPDKAPSTQLYKNEIFEFFDDGSYKSTTYSRPGVTSRFTTGPTFIKISGLGTDVQQHSVTFSEDNKQMFFKGSNTGYLLEMFFTK